MSDERAKYFLGSGMQEGWPMTIDRLVALYPPKWSASSLSSPSYSVASTAVNASS